MKKYDWSKDKVEDAIRKSFNYRDALRKLGINPSGNNGETLKRKIKEYNIDISHFTFHTDTLPKLEKSVFNFLTENSTITNNVLKKKLFKSGLKENKCEICHCTTWLGKPLVCQLHHKNGNNRDNRLENLQILCPNCHSQTDTYCGNHNKTEKEKNYCECCGRELKTKYARHCNSCAAKQRGKIAITKEDFIELLKHHKCNRTQMAIELKVSETAIRKWCKVFGLPEKSTDLKKELL